MKFFWLPLFCLSLFYFSFECQAEEKIQSAILDGSLYLSPVEVNKEKGCEENGIQPGKALKCSVIVENKGKDQSPSGQLFVRFCYAPPLDRQPGSLLFETEKKGLPSIEPGENVEIFFEKAHQTPTVIDFIHYDWLMREYEAIAVIDENEKVIGALSLTISAYYYPTVKKEYPSKIKAGKLEESTPPSF